MGQLQNVSWRTAGYAALGTALAAASVIAVINSDGVKPTALTSNAATRWLVDRTKGNVVLVDGLAGKVLAKITTDSNMEDEVAVQGAGGAFLVGQLQGAVRTISTSKLQLGTAQPLALLTETGTKFGVGASGLTVVNPDSDKAKVVAVDDVSRDIDVPTANSALVAADGSMWLMSATDATHVNVDQSSNSVALPSRANQQITVGSKAVTYDGATLRWLDGAGIDLSSVLPNPSEAVLQVSSDAAPCVWVGSDDTMVCVGATGVVDTKVIEGMHLDTSYQLAVAGNAAVIVDDQSNVTRLDLENQRLASDPKPDVDADAGPLKITAAADMIWLDEEGGQHAWVVQRFGINVIDKDARRRWSMPKASCRTKATGWTPARPRAVPTDRAATTRPSTSTPIRTRRTRRWRSTTPLRHAPATSSRSRSLPTTTTPTAVRSCSSKVTRNLQPTAPPM